MQGSSNSKEDKDEHLSAGRIGVTRWAASPATLVVSQGDKGKHSHRNQSATLMHQVHQQGSEFMLFAHYLEAQNC